jgi:hypothetical protein
MQTSIEQFTLSLLAYKGALLEVAEAGGHSVGVLLGDELASALGMSEYERLVFDPSLDAGARRVDYDSLSFEAMGRLVEAMGPLACVRVSAPDLKAIDPEKELERALRLQNGVFRFSDYAPATQLYFCFFLQYDVMADERSGGVTELWVNPSTRSMPRVAPVIETVEVRDDPPGPALGELAAQAWDLALPAASLSIRSRLRDFIESLQRRRERDLRRMRDYYQAIDEEIRRKIARPATKEESRKTEIQRLEATARAYQSRAAELLERYRVRVRVTGLATLACAIPTYQIRAQLLRRSAKREVSFSWNPFDRRIEPRCCDACAQATESAALCDDHVHYLCLNCLSPCPVCSKVFCRACQARCPRTHANTNP